jgi:hypothetical protein
MIKRRKTLKVLILAILGIIIILNFLGLIVELLFTLGIMQTDLVTVRTLPPIPTIISLAFLISACLLWFYLFKEKRLVFWFWHIFIAIALISTLYELREPTAITVLIPSYFIIMPLILIIIWAALFKFFRKLNRPI